MPRELKIAELGESVLYKRARQVPVRDINKPLIQELIEDMMATIGPKHGVGLAAPQIFHPLRIIILWSRPGPRYPTALEFGPLVLINPVISGYSAARAVAWEGCLSIPGFVGLVPRNETVCLEYRTETGIKKKCKLEGWPARILQHEVDHLEGILYLARIQSVKNLVTKNYWDKNHCKEISQSS
jgi:peptide deformylase